MLFLLRFLLPANAHVMVPNGDLTTRYSLDGGRTWKTREMSGVDVGSAGTTTIAFGRGAHAKTGEVVVRVGDRFVHMTKAPSLPPRVSPGTWFVRDNGAGKSQLCVRFSSGDVQVIATEP